MRTTIWKYPLATQSGLQMVSMPRDSVVRRFAVQDGSPCVWAEVDPTAAQVIQEFVIVGTGHQLPGGLFRYVGSCDDGPFVWHLYVNASDSAGERHE